MKSKRLVLVALVAIMMSQLALEGLRLYHGVQSYRIINENVVLKGHDNRSLITSNSTVGASKMNNVKGWKLVSYGTANNNKKASEILPNRLISVFGLESSGTTFVATTLATAMGKNDPGSVVLRWSSNDQQTHIHHISEPWGFFRHGDKNRLPPVVDVLFPEECMLGPHETVATRKRLSTKRLHARSDCEERLVINPSPRTYPRRFFVNVTSHISWYRQRGVDATAVIVVRDKSAHFQGVHKTHVANNATAAQEQYEVGKHILTQALKHLQDKIEVLLVSYETLMSFEDNYLFKIYDDLEINSTLVPEFKDGNANYLSK